jgi:hypothetical protein
MSVKTQKPITICRPPYTQQPCPAILNPLSIDIALKDKRNALNCKTGIQKLHTFYVL